MEVRITTRDDKLYVVDSDDPGNALNAFLEATDEEWVRVLAPVTGTKGLFVRRSEIKLVAVVDEDNPAAGEPGDAAAEPRRAVEPGQIF